MSVWGRKPFVGIRLLGTEGYYPRLDVQTSRHRVVATEELAWSAVLQSPFPDDWETSENPTVIPEEIRLFAAIAMCVEDPWNEGMPCVAHRSGRHEFQVDHGDDLNSPLVERRVSEAVDALCRDYMAGNYAHRKGEYEIGWPNRQDDVLKLVENIDVEDQLLLAGLANFLAADRLARPSVNETEVAALSLFVSIGAALEFLRLRLNDERGQENTPFADVHDYLGQVYPDGNYIPDYLEEIYQHRIIAVHPAGRFGEFWTPPLMAGDLFDLRKHTATIYRHIITGDRPRLQF